MNTYRLRSLFRHRNLVTITALFLLSVVAFFGFSAGASQSPEKEEREMVEKIPKHLPIKVKTRNPEKLKDAEDKGWLDDLSIEVTNTGIKPIYFLSIHLAMPDVLAPDGHKYVFLYKYGRIDLAAFEEPVRPDDVPILPGETVTLTPPTNHVEGWKNLREKGKVINPKKLELKFQEINHGDGTGFLGTGGTPMPVSKQRSANSPPAGGDSAVGNHRALPESPPKLILDSAYVTDLASPPVSLLPAVFTRNDFTIEPEPMRDICCQTSRPECIWMKPGGQTCICGEIPRMQFPACSDPVGACFTISYSEISCNDSTGFEHKCETSDFGDSCDGAPTPTPTPTPTPEPPTCACNDAAGRSPNPSCTQCVPKTA